MLFSGSCWWFSTFLFILLYIVFKFIFLLWTTLVALIVESEQLGCSVTTL